MAEDDNGSSSGGGNGSVWWNVTHGSKRKGLRPPKLANRFKVSMGKTMGEPPTVALDTPSGPLPHDSVMINGGVEGHDGTPFDRIGRPDHPGTFTVRLRFRRDDLRKPEVPQETRDLVAAYGKERPDLTNLNDLFVEIMVPAIQRNQPTENQPWEIYWGW